VFPERKLGSLERRKLGSDKIPDGYPIQSMTYSAWLLFACEERNVYNEILKKMASSQLWFNLFYLITKGNKGSDNPKRPAMSLSQHHNITLLFSDSDKGKSYLGTAYPTGLTRNFQSNLISSKNISRSKRQSSISKER
jgi:hypothetical protein